MKKAIITENMIKEKERIKKSNVRKVSLKFVLIRFVEKCFNF